LGAAELMESLVTGASGFAWSAFAERRLMMVGKSANVIPDLPAGQSPELKKSCYCRQSSLAMSGACWVKT
jgi:hypothetical protein